MRTSLRKAREAAGLTQEAVARKLGVNRTTYSRYEVGSRTPDVAMALRIATVLGRNVEDLFATQGPGGRASEAYANEEAW